MQRTASPGGGGGKPARGPARAVSSAHAPPPERWRPQVRRDPYTGRPLTDEHFESTLRYGAPCRLDG